MSICEMVKTHKWYYLCNTKSGYFPINRTLHSDRKREREEEREQKQARERERLCSSVKL